MRPARWLLYGLLTAVLVGFSTGCGGMRDKGTNRDKDQPRPEKQPPPAGAKNT